MVIEMIEFNVSSLVIKYKVDMLLSALMAQRFVPKQLRCVDFLNSQFQPYKDAYLSCLGMND
jgi:hypothetical protein